MVPKQFSCKFRYRSTFELSYNEWWHLTKFSRRLTHAKCNYSYLSKNTDQITTSWDENTFTTCARAKYQDSNCQLLCLPLAPKFCALSLVIKWLRSCAHIISTQAMWSHWKIAPFHRCTWDKRDKISHAWLAVLFSVNATVHMHSWWSKALAWGNLQSFVEVWIHKFIKLHQTVCGAVRQHHMPLWSFLCYSSIAVLLL